MKPWKSRSGTIPPFPWNAESVSREFPAHPCPSQAPTFPRLGIFREFQPAIPGKTPPAPWAIPGQHPGITEAPIPTEFQEIHPASQNPAGGVVFFGNKPWKFGNIRNSRCRDLGIPRFPSAGSNASLPIPKGIPWISRLLSGIPSSQEWN